MWIFDTAAEKMKHSSYVNVKMDETKALMDYEINWNLPALVCRKYGFINHSHWIVVQFLVVAEDLKKIGYGYGDGMAMFHLEFNLRNIYMLILDIFKSGKRRIENCYFCWFSFSFTLSVLRLHTKFKNDTNNGDVILQNILPTAEAGPLYQAIQSLINFLDHSKYDFFANLSYHDESESYQLNTQLPNDDSKLR